MRLGGDVRRRGCSSLIHLLLLSWALIISIWIYDIVYEIRESIDYTNKFDKQSGKVDERPLEEEALIYIRKLKDQYKGLKRNDSCIQGKNDKMTKGGSYTRMTNGSPVFIKSSDEDMPRKSLDSLYHFPRSEQAILQSYLYHEFEPFQMVEYWHLTKHNFPEWTQDKNLPPWMDKFWDDEIY